MSQSFAATQAGHLATVAKLFSYTAPELAQARVLEIGCSFGGNLLPMAIAHPEMELVGLDLSEVQIQKGNELISRLGLTNIKLESKDILEYQGEHGKFDYIICHGVFSWVPKIVQKKIFEVIQKSLSERGLAVVSYNTNPGWKNISILRDSMLFREKLFKRKGVKTEHYEEIVERGKKVAEFIRDYSSRGEELKEQVDSLLGKSSHYIYHEYYEEYNEAFYLYDWNDFAKEYGLCHVCDTDLNKSLPIYRKEGVNMDASLEQECAGDHIAVEQYYDFLNMQQFRSSILMHEEAAKDFHISKNIPKKNLEALYLRQGFARNQEGKYLFEDGSVIADYFQDLAAYLTKHYPESVLIEELVASEEFAGQEEAHKKVLQFIYERRAQASTEPFHWKKAEKPKLKEIWRRYLSYFQEEENPIVSFSLDTGVILKLDELQRRSLLELDGSKDLPALWQFLLEERKKGKINISTTSKATEEELLHDYAKNIFFIAERFGWLS